MIRNAKRFGVLTTLNGWVFMCRGDQGKLCMTRMIRCDASNPTVLQVLYYLSSQTAACGQLIETDAFGRPVQLELADAKYARTPTPQVPGPSVNTSAGAWTNAQGNYNQGYYSLQADPEAEPLKVIFEPWISSNNLGAKAFIFTLVSDERVAGKVWDGYKNTRADRDNEVEAYFRLQTLWGKQIPKFIACGMIDFMWTILLEFIEATSIAID